jgi:serine/threonine protein kinase
MIVTNPVTKRRIKVGGKTYNELMNDKQHRTAITKQVRSLKRKGGYLSTLPITTDLFTEYFNKINPESDSTNDYVQMPDYTQADNEQIVIEMYFMSLVYIFLSKVSMETKQKQMQLSRSNMIQRLNDIDNNQWTVKWTQFSAKLNQTHQALFDVIFGGEKPNTMLDTMWNAYKIFVKGYCDPKYFDTMFDVHLNIYYVWKFNSTTANGGRKSGHKGGNANTSYIDKTLKLAIVRGAGTYMLKIFQRFANVDNDIKQGYENVATMTNMEYDNLFKEVTKRFKDIEVSTPKRVASIGQVHVATWDRQEWIIKFLKPRSIVNMYSEHIYVGSIAKELNLEQDIVNLIQYEMFQIVNEFDFNAEKLNIKKCLNLYKDISLSTIQLPNEGIVLNTPIKDLAITEAKDIRENPSKTPLFLRNSVPSPVIEELAKQQPSRPVSKKEWSNAVVRLPHLDYFFIMMTKANGESLQHFLQISNGAEICAKILPTMQILISKWFSNIFLNTPSGYFHADLHPGNIIVNPENDNVQLIDFGHVGILEENQKSFLLKVILKYLTIVVKAKSFRQEKEMVNSFAFIEAIKPLLQNILEYVDSMCHSTNANGTTYHLVSDNNRPIIIDTLVKFFIDDIKNKTLDSHIFGKFLDKLVKSLPSLEACQQNQLVDFMKGINLLQNTWTALIDKIKMDPNVYSRIQRKSNKTNMSVSVLDVFLTTTPKSKFMAILPIDGSFDLGSEYLNKVILRRKSPTIKNASNGQHIPI